MPFTNMSCRLNVVRMEVYYKKGFSRFMRAQYVQKILNKYILTSPSKDRHAIIVVAYIIYSEETFYYIKYFCCRGGGRIIFKQLQYLFIRR